MALSKNRLAADWANHQAKVNQLFLSGASEKKIFEELCNPVYSGDEFENVPGIIDNDVNDLIATVCHIIVADCAISLAVDNKIVVVPDHNEIISLIFSQLKRDNVDIQTIFDAIEESLSDTDCWFINDRVECSRIQSDIEKIWNDAKKYPSR